MHRRLLLLESSSKALRSHPLPPPPPQTSAFAWPLYSKFFFYRVLFDAPAGAAKGLNTLLHFGAVDWNTTVYLNGAKIGAHIGGYDAFSFDVTAALQPAGNELILAVFDPSEKGDNPAGKQWIAAISGPGSVFYTPNTGIWQTVWLESVPAFHISALKLRGSMTHLHLTVAMLKLWSPARVRAAVAALAAAAPRMYDATGTTTLRVRVRGVRPLWRRRRRGALS
jgi:beta-galactosidase/beta-glucuronidase